MNRRRFQKQLGQSVLSSALGAIPAVTAQTALGQAMKMLPLPGQVFQVDENEVFLISPGNPKKGSIPWVWYSPTLKPLPGPEERWMIQKFFDVGVAIAGIDVGESYGSPKGRRGFTAFYDHMTKTRGFSVKPAMLGRSRGGLQVYNWAVEHPRQVSCIAGIYPVCDVFSWPGLNKAAPAYGMTPDELKNYLVTNNPVSRLESLVEAKVPIFHIHGDVDTVVPLEANSGAVANNYKKLGGTMSLEVPKGQGHNMWRGFFESQNLVDFILKHVRSET
ncbi:MAG: prolyl oligopeptidase family serine peptidase [Planctomycetota bacterium]